MEAAGIISNIIWYVTVLVQYYTAKFIAISMKGSAQTILDQIQTQAYLFEIPAQAYSESALPDNLFVSDGY